MADSPISVEVEVCLHSTSAAAPAAVESRVTALLERVNRERGADAAYATGPLDLSADPFLAKHVHHARICDLVAPAGWASHTDAYAARGTGGAGSGAGAGGGSGSVYLPFAPYWRSELTVMVYQLSEDGPSSESAGGTEGSGGGEGGGGDVQTQYTQWNLPAVEFEGTWESLVYDDDEEEVYTADSGTAAIAHGAGGHGAAAAVDASGLAVAPAAKRPRGAPPPALTRSHTEVDAGAATALAGSRLKPALLQYAQSALLFSDAGVNTSLVSWNSVVLLHGPPGTGKTSLCKALAHKLAIRFAHRYPSAQLIEINAHSLFSRWFSESGKLVHRLFSHINELVSDEESLVCLLIDEVESLTAARKAAVSGSEPSDAVRVVNAVLTAIDSFRTKRNVLLLTTSNVSDAIDVAFVDRADIKAFVGPPGAKARYDIIASCVTELARVGVVSLGPPGAGAAAALALGGSASASAGAAASVSLGASSASSTSTVSAAADARRNPAFRLGTAAEAKQASAATTTAAAAAAPAPAPVSSWSAAAAPTADAMDADAGLPGAALPADVDAAASALLWRAAAAAEGFSGRTLRKLPLQAHAMYVRAPRCTGQQFANAVLKAVLAEKSARADFKDL